MGDVLFLLLPICVFWAMFPVMLSFYLPPHGNLITPCNSPCVISRFMYILCSFILNASTLATFLGSCCISSSWYFLCLVFPIARFPRFVPVSFCYMSYYFRPLVFWSCLAKYRAFPLFSFSTEDYFSAIARSLLVVQRSPPRPPYPLFLRSFVFKSPPSPQWKLLFLSTSRPFTGFPKFSFSHSFRAFISPHCLLGISYFFFGDMVGLPYYCSSFGR